jgi:hypothetical protein
VSPAPRSAPPNARAAANAGWANAVTNRHRAASAITSGRVVIHPARRPPAAMNTTEQVTM